MLLSLMYVYCMAFLSASQFETLIFFKFLILAQPQQNKNAISYKYLHNIAVLWNNNNSLKITI